MEDSSSAFSEHNENDGNGHSKNEEDSGSSNDSNDSDDEDLLESVCTTKQKQEDSGSSNDNSDSDDEDLPVSKTKQKQRKITKELWSGMKAELVENLPEGVDGLRVFKIPLQSCEEEGRNTLRDGRKWKKNCPTEWKGHNRVRYADCKGSSRCYNAHCPFKLEFGVVNTTQFKNLKDGSVVCSACNQQPAFVKCPARRYISYYPSFTKVFYCGNHTCPVIKPLKKNKSQVRQLIKDNPKIKPSEIQSACIMSAFREKADWATVEKEVEATLDRQWLSNVKKQMKRDTEPLGHDFEAVVTFKQYCDKKDSFFIYKINDRRGNPDRPSFVFKMGTQKAKMAINMDKNGNHFLGDEFCYFDGKRKRCRGFVTLTASVYHTLLRKQIPLAVMEAENEDTTNIELFWTLFNEVLQKVSGQKDYKFHPVGWCTDMAGANFAAITKVFGEEATARMKSCEFHFKDQRNKKAQRLDNDSSDRFKELCDKLLKSATEAGYNNAKAAIDTFIEEREEHAFLKTWVSWWHDRRGFICRAFAPKDAPAMNQAEVIHAGWAHRDSPNLSLLDVCHADVRDTVIVDKELETYQAGIPSLGKGPSFAECRRRQHVRQLEKAKRIGQEMFEDSENGRFIDPSSSCQPPKTKKRKGKKAASSQSKEVTVDPGSAALGVTPNMPPSYVPPFTVPPSFVAPQNVPPSYVLPSGVPPSNMSMSVPSNSSMSYWHQAFPSFTHWSSPPPFAAPSADPSPPPTITPQYGNQWHSGMSPHHYEIVMLPSNVQKCYGCGAIFSERSRSAPFNLCIKHVDKRVIGKNADGHLIYSRDYTNTYYHPSMPHIKRKNPLFTGLVYIEADLYNSLDARYRQVLESFQFNVILK